MLQWLLWALVWVAALAIYLSLIVLPKDDEVVLSLGGPGVIVPVVALLALALSGVIRWSLRPVGISNLDDLLRAIGEVEQAGLRLMKALYAVKKLPEDQQQRAMGWPEIQDPQQGWGQAYSKLRGEMHVAGERRFLDVLSALTGFVSIQIELQKPGAQEVGENKKFAMNDELMFVGELASRTAKTIEEVKKLARGK